MNLAAYLDRIGHSGPTRPDLATLKALHRAHLLVIPYENLDVQMGRPLTTDPAAAFDKLVTRRRGGWCYEMNGLLGWALGEVGFDVTRIAGGVMRGLRGDWAIGTHLVLKVMVEGQPWIADVGFGDGPLDPYPLSPAAFEAAGYAYRLERLEDGFWRLHNQPAGMPPYFDFQDQAAEEAVLAERCVWLQSAPDSNFVLNAVLQRHRPDCLLSMRGRVLRASTPAGHSDRLIGSAEEYVAVLADEFGVDLPEAAGLWPKIVARHEAVIKP